ncbi:MAG: aquaporin [Lactobacillales bacterium]|jgi:aquaporin Z|nr:aquaporin [Lactobacillales bacterium]
MKKGIAEVIGTFILVFVGTGAVVLSGESVGTLGIAVAFGLTIVAAAYSIGTISGAHLNPAVSIAMFMNGRLNVTELLTYIGAQIVGAFLGTASLYGILYNANKSVDELGQNALQHVDATGGLMVEGLLTFIFVLVILTVTSKKFGQPSLAGLVIGFTLTLIHFVGVPLTGMSANPARSLAPAIFTGGVAFSDLWIFIVGPILGAIVAAIIAKYVFDTEEE